jgi:hypothetical protein
MIPVLGRVRRRGGLHTLQQAIWGLPDVSRVPVAKHPRFGRYFCALFEAVMGCDLMTSFDRPRAESSPALTLKLVAAITTATIPKGPASDFTLIVEPPSVAPAGYHARCEIRTHQDSGHPGGINPHFGCVLMSPRHRAHERMAMPVRRSAPSSQPPHCPRGELD